MLRDNQIGDDVARCVAVAPGRTADQQRDHLSAAQPGSPADRTWTGSSWLAAGRASGVAFSGFVLRARAARMVDPLEHQSPVLCGRGAQCLGRRSGEPFEAIWIARTTDEQMALIQIARERIANPYQRSVVRQLLKDGALRMVPDLEPCSPPFGEFLATRTGSSRRSSGNGKA